ncbi:hypothetical protein F2Q70_00013670 [Brassica cretica]|uniref:Uncharacterized protein n=1 Tax=Brassica cretica TaxID=69181 RepID=A0A8S9LV91_BRACR|nr:hypothetical protein F2Q70_00013670 [Brassica cretica]
MHELSHLHLHLTSSSLISISISTRAFSSPSHAAMSSRPVPCIRLIKHML